MRVTTTTESSIDPSVVRGLEYYTGPVFEVELTFSTDRRGRHAVRFGSVGGGGRYDGLVSRFRGEPVPATGFSIGVSRLLAALSIWASSTTSPSPARSSSRCSTGTGIADYQNMVRDAARRRHPRRALSRQSGKFGAQMKYADKRGAPCVVIQGGDEKAKGEVQIKDLILGAELASWIKDRERAFAEAGRGAVRGAGSRPRRDGAQQSLARTRNSVTPRAQAAY